jgi:hypothetical protein
MARAHRTDGEGARQLFDFVKLRNAYASRLNVLLELVVAVVAMSIVAGLLWTLTLQVRASRRNPAICRVCGGLGRIRRPA